MITSTDFISKIKDCYDIKLIESKTAKRMAVWIMDYYEKYGTAPGKAIEPIFFSKAKNLPEDIVEDIQDILEDLSEENLENPINVDYLVDEIRTHFNEKSLIRHSEEVKALVQQGKLLEAEQHALNYKPIVKDTNDWIDLSEEEAVIAAVDDAFKTTSQNIISFPGALGEMLNDQLVREGFVAFMGSEKRGKTFWLLEFAMRAAKQKRNVAFFQAGDMTRNQQLMRVGIYLAKKSNKEKYCGVMYEPVRDCVFNQNDTCKREERACDFGPFSGKSEKELRDLIEFDELKETFLENEDYVPCTDCADFAKNKWGVPWLKLIEAATPLTNEEAKKHITDFFVKHKRRFKIATYPTDTLTVKMAKTTLDIWEKRDGFMVDVIIFDYPDIMSESSMKEERHRQNKIWMQLRALGQEKHALMIAVTQADADSYTRDLLTRKNFSEDKRKFAHPTAFYALNQDHFGIEKDIGIMRINELAGRESDTSAHRPVYVLQNLRRGRPFITSYW